MTAPRRYRETSDYAAMMTRMVKAYSRRVGEGGDIAALAEMVAKRAEMDAAISLAAAQLHDAGYSWTEIGTTLGISRQAARQRFDSSAPPSKSYAEYVETL